MICIFCGRQVFRVPVTVEPRSAWSGKKLPKIEQEGQSGHGPTCPYTVAMGRERERVRARERVR